jgi:hypothetical protein
VRLARDQHQGEVTRQMFSAARLMRRLPHGTLVWRC